MMKFHNIVNMNSLVDIRKDDMSKRHTIKQRRSSLFGLVAIFDSNSLDAFAAEVLPFLYIIFRSSKI